MGMKVGSLFSGIGGIELGLEWAGFEPSWQVENDPFCNRILEKRWPGVQRFLDIRSVGQHNLPPVDLVCGGFPCQDVSIAAQFKERGLGGQRSGLWTEYARVVRELRPRWVLVENVPNLKNHGADRVVSDMEEAGYSCWPTVVGADVFGAPYQRRRVFVLCRDDSHGHCDIGEDMARGWALPAECERKVAEAVEGWNHWKHELGAGDAGQGGASGQPRADAYAGGVRDILGIPDCVDRLKAVGNACTPVIPALIGSFVLRYERRMTELTAESCSNFARN